MIFVVFACVVGAAIATNLQAHTRFGAKDTAGPAKTVGCSGPGGIFCDGFETGNTIAWGNHSASCTLSDLDLPVPAGRK